MTRARKRKGATEKSFKHVWRVQGEGYRPAAAEKEQGRGKRSSWKRMDGYGSERKDQETS